MPAKFWSVVENSIAQENCHQNVARQDSAKARLIVDFLLFE
jgi:hypothetical protein